ncbi:MAG: STAS domain-containing protein [Anaerolineae bacterium]
MELTTRHLKRCDVVAATGRVDAYTSPKLAEALAAILHAGRYRIVFDMSGVEYISSVGLRALIDAYKACKRYQRGRIVLASPRPFVRQTLALTGFCTFLNVYDTVVEAVGNV